MLSELQRARAYAGRVAWRVPHPVRTRYCAKALRQIERQILAELEELYGVPVEIDPLLTDGGRQARAVENSSTRTTSAVPQNESPTSRTGQKRGKLSRST
jgi:hypothetical protein